MLQNKIRKSNRIERLSNAFEQVGRDHVRVCASRAIAEGCSTPPVWSNLNMHAETKTSTKACKNVIKEATVGEK